MELQKIAQITGEVLGIDAKDITPDTEFVKDLGADSLEIFQIMVGLETQFDIAIEDKDFQNVVTVKDALRQIRKLTHG